MSDFIVRFMGIDLSPESQSRIQGAIQQAVFTELSSVAKYEPGKPAGQTEEGGFLFYSPVKWRGGLLMTKAFLDSNKGSTAINARQEVGGGREE
jgi:hypothetical protein